MVKNKNQAEPEQKMSLAMYYQWYECAKQLKGEFPVDLRFPWHIHSNALTVKLKI